ncbi:hypothetical protein K2Z84_24800 [Candidatus Binatia bacterium]|nr:hypothetical protein [Candidatus Binatia bacterium]
MSIAVALVIAGATLAHAADPDAGMWSGPECDRVAEVIVANGLTTSKLSKDQISCESYIRNASYVVLLTRCLRCRSEDEGPGSTLVGYFAVRRSDGRVFRWDFANDRIEGHGYPDPRTPATRRH